MKQGAKDVCVLQKSYTSAFQLLVIGLLSLHPLNLE